MTLALPLEDSGDSGVPNEEIEIEEEIDTCFSDTSDPAEIVLPLPQQLPVSSSAGSSSHPPPAVTEHLPPLFSPAKEPLLQEDPPQPPVDVQLPPPPLPSPPPPPPPQSAPPSPPPLMPPESRHLLPPAPLLEAPQAAADGSLRTLENYIRVLEAESGQQDAHAHSSAATQSPPRPGQNSPRPGQSPPRPRQSSPRSGQSPTPSAGGWELQSTSEFVPASYAAGGSPQSKASLLAPLPDEFQGLIGIESVGTWAPQVVANPYLGVPQLRDGPSLRDVLQHEMAALRAQTMAAQTAAAQATAAAAKAAVVATQQQPQQRYHQGTGHQQWERYEEEEWRAYFSSAGGQLSPGLPSGRLVQSTDENGSLVQQRPKGPLSLPQALPSDRGVDRGGDRGVDRGALLDNTLALRRLLAETELGLLGASKEIELWRDEASAFRARATTAEREAAATQQRLETALAEAGAQRRRADAAEAAERAERNAEEAAKRTASAAVAAAERAEGEAARMRAKAEEAADAAGSARRALQRAAAEADAQAKEAAVLRHRLAQEERASEAARAAVAHSRAEAAEALRTQRALLRQVRALQSALELMQGASAREHPQPLSLPASPPLPPQRWAEQPLAEPRHLDRYFEHSPGRTGDAPVRPHTADTFRRPVAADTRPPAGRRRSQVTFNPFTGESTDVPGDAVATSPQRAHHAGPPPGLQSRPSGVLDSMESRGFARHYGTEWSHEDAGPAFSKEQLGAWELRDERGGGAELPASIRRPEVALQHASQTWSVPQHMDDNMTAWPGHEGKESELAAAAKGAVVVRGPTYATSRDLGPAIQAAYSAAASGDQGLAALPAQPVPESRRPASGRPSPRNNSASVAGVLHNDLMLRGSADTGRRPETRPFATAMSASDYIERVGALDSRLLALSQERDLLEAEMVRLPAGSGRTQHERRRKAAGEGRLEELRSEICSVRTQLRQFGVP